MTDSVVNMGIGVAKINRVSSLLNFAVYRMFTPYSLTLHVKHVSLSAFVLCSVGCGQTDRFLHGQ